jgi:anaerobic ribonucleoside-triphosphate reductase activating protein
MRLFGRQKSTSVNGPGDRALVHVQGCNLGCRNCWNPESHDPNNYQLELSAKDLAKWIIAEAKDGVTFSGGEPMQQSNELVDLIYLVKSRRPDLSIGMYTGYTQKELDECKYFYTRTNDFGVEKMWVLPSNNPWKYIKCHLDFAIMGRFNEQLLDVSTSLRSSTNQKLVLFSDRYKESDFQSQQIEFTIGNGLTQITGFPVGMPELLSSKEW